jgi:hypothetical protein
MNHRIQVTVFNITETQWRPTGTKPDLPQNKEQTVGNMTNNTDTRINNKISHSTSGTTYKMVTQKLFYVL